MSTPKFSVITVSYQHVDYIRQTIESVLNQRYPNFEHIVIDGGSTDGTLDILKAYPHLKWTSEPDRGQSHALNKGFARATGDIIAWINSDDWYPPGVFKDVALALEDYPIVMGACEVCDKYGVRQEVVHNIKRSWFDIVKHWVFNSSPAQPSIFFRRELLEQVKYPDGRYIDEDLEFCMDFDLWLRIAEKYPLSRRVKKVFSCLRTYDTNKTGEMWDLATREMSRVYHRHSQHLARTETRMSVVVPIGNTAIDFQATLDSVAISEPGTLELVMLYHGADHARGKAIRRQVLEAQRKVTSNTVRYVRLDSCDVFAALNLALDAVRAPLVTVLQPGDRLPPNWTAQAEQEFQRDNVAIVLPYGHKPEVRSLFRMEREGRVSFRADAAFGAPDLLPNFVARHVALKELGGFKPHPGTDVVSSLLAFRQLLLRTLFKGWAILAETHLQLPQGTQPLVEEHQLMEAFHMYSNAALLADLKKEFEAEPFAQLRAQHGFTLLFPEEFSESAAKLLSLAPSDWPRILEDRNSKEKLLEWTEKSPHFTPAWALLARLAKGAGDEALVQRANQGYTGAEAAQAKL